MDDLPGQRSKRPPILNKELSLPVTFEAISENCLIISKRQSSFPPTIQQWPRIVLLDKNISVSTVVDSLTQVLAIAGSIQWDIQQQSSASTIGSIPQALIFLVRQLTLAERILRKLQPDHAV
jgi:hypothetical protein